MLLLARVAAADADPATERARAHVKAAIAYYDDGKYEDAAREMSVAYGIRPLADLQYNLAQCYERLGRYDEAAQAYEKYLAGRPDASDRKQVQARMAGLRERAKAQAEGQAAPPAPVEKVVLKTVVVYKEIPPPPGRVARGAAYGLWALAAGGLASGIAFAVLAKDASDEVTRSANPERPGPFPEVTQANGETYAVVSGVSFGIGAAALAGGLALYLVGNKIDREHKKQYTLAPALSPSGGGLLATGRF